MIYRHDVSWDHICIYMHIVHLCLETKKMSWSYLFAGTKTRWNRRNRQAGTFESERSQGPRQLPSYRCPIFQHNFGARLKMEHTPRAGTFSREHGDKPSNYGVPMGTLFSEKPILWPLQCQWICHSFEVETLRNHLLRSKERRKSHDVRDADNQTHKPEVAGQRRIRQDESEKTSDKTGCLKWVMLGMDHS